MKTVTLSRPRPAKNVPARHAAVYCVAWTAWSMIRGFHWTSPRYCAVAVVVMMPMRAVRVTVIGRAVNIAGVGECRLLAYLVQSDTRSDPPVYVPAIDVMP